MKRISFKLLLLSILLILSVEIASAQKATLTINQDPKISKLLELKKELEKENKLTDGYTIQLYYGELKKANDILSRYRNSYKEWPASLEYETPNYKIWVGNFDTRIEADRALLELRRSFPSAFIFKPN